MQPRALPLVRCCGPGLSAYLGLAPSAGHCLCLHRHTSCGLCCCLFIIDLCSRSRSRLFSVALSEEAHASWSIPQLSAAPPLDSLGPWPAANCSTAKSRACHCSPWRSHCGAFGLFDREPRERVVLPSSSAVCWAAHALCFKSGVLSASAAVYNTGTSNRALP